MGDRASSRPLVTSDMVNGAEEIDSDGPTPDPTPTRNPTDSRPNKKRKTIEDQLTLLREQALKSKKLDDTRKWAFEKEHLEFRKRKEESPKYRIQFGVGEV